MSKICSSCNAKNSDEAKFCRNCGKKLEENNKETMNKEECETIFKEYKLIEFFFSAKGRISRQEFFVKGFIPLTVLLFLTGTAFKILNIMILNEKIDIAMVQPIHFMLIGIYLVIIYSILAVSIKRFHDCNISGWMSTLLFIPLVNFIGTLYMMFKKSVNYNNKYGQIISKYQMNGVKWLLLIVNIILLLLSIIFFSFSNVFEKSTMNKQQTKEKWHFSSHRMNYNEAENYCSSLSNRTSYRWRLPYKNEFKQLMNIENILILDGHYNQYGDMSDKQKLQNNIYKGKKYFSNIKNKRVLNKNGGMVFVRKKYINDLPLINENNKAAEFWIQNESGDYALSIDVRIGIGRYISKEASNYVACIRE